MSVKEERRCPVCMSAERLNPPYLAEGSPIAYTANGELASTTVGGVPSACPLYVFGSASGPSAASRNSFCGAGPPAAASFLTNQTPGRLHSWADAAGFPACGHTSPDRAPSTVVASVSVRS